MYRMRILVNGNPIPIFDDYRNGKKWIEARKDSIFSIKIENSSYNRVLAVISVDGLNVINAKHEDPHNSTGYIINSNSSIVVPGWLIDQEKVREFVFTERGTSYAKKIGADQSNIGVIGAAIFPEKPRYHLSTWNSQPTFSYSFSNGYNYSNGAVPITATNFTEKLYRSDVSVGSGEYQNYNTEEVSFNRDKLETTLVIYYENKEKLIEMGILDNNSPQPFLTPTNYCPDV